MTDSSKHPRQRDFHSIDCNGRIVIPFSLPSIMERYPFCLGTTTQPPSAKPSIRSFEPPPPASLPHLKRTEAKLELVWKNRKQLTMINNITVDPVVTMKRLICSQFLGLAGSEIPAIAAAR